MGMKIVVIGGTGLIGSKVVAKLKARSHEAVAAAPTSVSGDPFPEIDLRVDPGFNF